MKVSVILGSVRSGRQGIKAAKFIAGKLKARGHDPTIVDPLNYDLPLLDKRFKDYKDEKAPAKMEELSATLRNSDAIVVVSAEYNHFPPPALINLLDHYLSEFFWKPSAIVSYSDGGFGGARAAEMLKIPLLELGCPPIPTLFHISRIKETLGEDGAALDKAYDERAAGFLDELEWYMRALKAEREKGVPY